MHVGEGGHQTRVSVVRWQFPEVPPHAQYLGLVLQVKRHGCADLPGLIPYLRGDDGRAQPGA